MLDSAQGQIVDLQKQIGDKKYEIQKADQARTAAASLDSNEATVKSFMVKKDSIVSFIESLQSTGKGLGSGVQVVSVTDDKANGHPRISLSLLITGSFDSVMRTVGTLENSPYDATLTNLTLDSGTPTPKGVQQWSAATTLSVGVDPTPSVPTTKP